MRPDVVKLLAPLGQDPLLQLAGRRRERLHIAAQVNVHLLVSPPLSCGDASRERTIR